MMINYHGLFLSLLTASNKRKVAAII